MPTELRWIASASASCFHATQALLSSQQIIDASLADALATPAEELAGALAEQRVPRDIFFQNLVPLAAGIDSNRALAQLALTKTLGPAGHNESRLAELTRLLTNLEQTFQRVLPGLVDQLELRSAPLRELWEARGPGLLHQLGKLIDPEFIVPRADVILVHPALGGSGAAHIAFNSVRIEAMLVNPWPEVPEVVRLAWLAAHLNLDLPKYQGDFVPGAVGSLPQAAKLGSLALVPLTLASAEAVELSGPSVKMLQTSLAAWHLASADDLPRLGERLFDWWQVYRDTRPAWPVAIAALDEMLKQ